MGGKAGYHHGDLRRALLTAAREMLRDQGASGLSLRALASRAGVSSAAPYRHFPDKDALLAALMTEGFEELAGHFATTATDPMRRLRHLGHAYLAFATAEPELSRLMFDPGGPDRAAHPALARAEAATHAAFTGAIEEAMAAGMITGPSPELIALTLRCVTQGLIAMVTSGQIPDHELTATADMIMDMLDTGLHPRPPHKP
ncbi:TetR/AcrR family transcriptional regulator [Spirillospora sp. CA-294931]|uniref:TetR/AcrR family transcriptional regulator n=1 Tax=Spirillospora sp. CA-294931 TaxID=3240042 RepID=UPI003D9243C6